jgi:hypothetical protein
LVKPFAISSWWAFKLAFMGFPVCFTIAALWKIHLLLFSWLALSFIFHCTSWSTILLRHIAFCWVNELWAVAIITLKIGRKLITSYTLLRWSFIAARRSVPYILSTSYKSWSCSCWWSACFLTWNNDGLIVIEVIHLAWSNTLLSSVKLSAWWEDWARLWIINW